MQVRADRATRCGAYRGGDGAPARRVAPGAGRGAAYLLSPAPWSPLETNGRKWQRNASDVIRSSSPSSPLLPS